MKKIISSILAGTMLIISIGTATVFADEQTTSTSSNSTVIENIDELKAEKNGSCEKEKNSNKIKYLIMAAGVLVVAAIGTAICFGNNYKVPIYQETLPGSKGNVSEVPSSYGDSQCEEGSYCLAEGINYCLPLDEDKAGL